MGAGARRGLLVAGGVLLLALSAAALATGAGRPRPSLVLVTVAGLRADDIRPETMPQLSALAAEGQAETLVTNVPLAAPALASLFSGREPDASGVRFDDLGRLVADAPTLAERFAARGVHTWAYVGDGRISLMSGLYRGFERVSLPSSPFDHAILPDERERVRAPRRGVYASADLIGAVADTIKGLQRVSRVFAWVHAAEPSLALAARGEDGAGARLRALRELDTALGTLRGLARSARLGRRVGLVVVSVHGEALGAGGETRHGLSLAEPVTAVPLVARLPEGRRLELDAPALSHLGRALLAALGEPAARASGSGPALSATWLPWRRFGWPDEARVRKDGRWRSLDPADERAVRAGLHLGAAAPADRAGVLAEMARADAAVRARQAGAALEAFDRAGRLAPAATAPRIGALQLVSLLTRAQRREVRERTDRLIGELERIADEGTPEQRIDLARALLALGRRDEAARIALDAAGRRPDDGGLQLAAADVLSGAEQFEEAARLVLAVADREGPARAPELFEWAGDRLRRGGNAYRARLAYEAALRSRRARSADLLAKLGDAYAELGDPETALQRWAEAVRVDPSYRYPHLRAGEVLLELGRRGAAIHAFILSAARTGQPIPDALVRARVLENHGLALEAAAELLEMARAHPRAVRLQAALTHSLASAGRLDQAREVVDQALSLMPNSGLLLAERARVEALAGDEAQAARDLERAIAAGVGEPLARRLAADPAFTAFGGRSAVGRLLERLVSER